MLTDSALKNAAAKPKPYRLSDSHGLYCIVTVTGSKWWRIDFRFDSNRRTLSLGTYPEVSLREARVMRDEIKLQIKAGIDPSLHRKAETIKSKAGDSFETIALEWHKQQTEQWSEGYASRILNLMKHDLFPFIGDQPLNEIDAPTLLAALRRMEARGVRDTTHRAREVAGSIFRYGVATGRCTSNPADALKGALTIVPTKHRAAVIEPTRFGKLIRDIDGYTGGLVVQTALKLTPLLALRPGELRHLEWTEVHLSRREIRIPSTKMKMNTDHIVPLSDQAMALIDSIKPLTGGGQYVFPSIRAPRGDRPMSENTINVALRTLGWDGKEICAHGFRGSFCSIANERLKFSADAIERQLAHAERNKVRAAYLHSDFLDERRSLMQAWADFLDELRASGHNLIPTRSAE